MFDDFEFGKSVLNSNFFLNKSGGKQRGPYLKCVHVRQKKSPGRSKYHK